MKRFKKYLSLEIGIDFKACVYFCVILFFYSLYQLWKGSFQANIIDMAEMIIMTYVMGYFQVYLLGGFDEEDKLGMKEIVKCIGCSFIYVIVSYVCNWFEKNIVASVVFFLYMLFGYLCVFLSYKIKRDIDTKQLNKDLEEFKNRKG